MGMDVHDRSVTMGVGVSPGEPVGVVMIVMTVVVNVFMVVLCRLVNVFMFVNRFK